LHPVDDGSCAVAVLRLRTGQTIALRGSGDYTATGIEVLSCAEPLSADVVVIVPGPGSTPNAWASAHPDIQAPGLATGLTGGQAAGDGTPGLGQRLTRWVAFGDVDPRPDRGGDCAHVPHALPDRLRYSGDGAIRSRPGRSHDRLVKS
jgi:hypothetical protein